MSILSVTYFCPCLVALLVLSILNVKTLWDHAVQYFCDLFLSMPCGTFDGVHSELEHLVGPLSILSVTYFSPCLVALLVVSILNLNALWDHIVQSFFDLF